MKITRSLIDEMSSRYRATFINSIEGFKSINLIGTRSTSGISNLAPFNSIVHIGSNPPLIGFVARPETEEHQTLKNIRETGSYTINHIHQDILHAAHQTSAKYDANTSEFMACGFTEQLTIVCDAPYVFESRLKYSLQLIEIITIDLNNTSLVIGEIQEIEIDDCTIEPDGFVHLEELGSMTCVGVDAYFNVSLKERLAYAKK